jgi:predicted alpha/beta-hydrolase family hydrolase
MSNSADLKSLGAITYPADPAASAGAASRALLVLAHGAGAGQKHPFMVATARGLAARGIDVVTFDFPYMARGRGGPDRPPVLEQSFRAVVEAATAWSRGGRLFIGGKSMGGRMATHLGAQHLEGLNGIVVLGYPLHPPGKPEQLRVAHLPSIEVPVLIVQGERDTFGTPDEFTPHLDAMRAPVTLHVVHGGDHSLTVRGPRGQGVHDSVMDTIAAWVSRTRVS